MKNLIILGAPRAGKTTLSRMIAEQLDMDSIHGDNFITAFQYVMPEIGIKHHSHSHDEILSKFIATYSCSGCYSDGSSNKRNFVLESASIPVEMAQTLFPEKNCKIVALGYPNANANDIFNRIRANDTADSWTGKITDAELLEKISEYIQQSKEIYLNRQNCGI